MWKTASSVFGGFVFLLLAIEKPGQPRAARRPSKCPRPLAARSPPHQRLCRRSTTTWILATTDFRAHPELYRVGKGEQGVLLVQPYKGEILPHWRFKDAGGGPGVVGGHLGALRGVFGRPRILWAPTWPRKFLQMGFTRARRYANHAAARSTPAPCPPTKKARAGPTAAPSCPAPTHPDPDKSCRRRHLQSRSGTRPRPARVPAPESTLS
ncbi:MAG: DUF4385 family protein [Hymenobacter sp.]